MKSTPLCATSHAWTHKPTCQGLTSRSSSKVGVRFGSQCAQQRYIAVLVTGTNSEHKTNDSTSGHRMVIMVASRLFRLQNQQMPAGESAVRRRPKCLVTRYAQQSSSTKTEDPYQRSHCRLNCNIALNRFNIALNRFHPHRVAIRRRSVLC